MPRMTSAYAKNIIRRTLRAVVDPEPTIHDIERVWEYFGSACAYCDQKLRHHNREGDIDHLVSGATNHISNRVLSCKPCNGDKKRDRDWLEFLRDTSSDKVAFRERRDKINSWCRANRPTKQILSNLVIQKEIDQAIRAFELAYLRLYRLRKHAVCRQDSRGQRDCNRGVKS
jgi:hypothetical protein